MLLVVCTAIEEILSLSSEPKNPSLTIYLKPEDEDDREAAQTVMNMLEHTRLKDNKSIDICFDPDDMNTNIEEGLKTMIERYYEFEKMVSECNDNDVSENAEKSKWIIRTG